jgi:hypothetical protein
MPREVKNKSIDSSDDIEDKNLVAGEKYQSLINHLT